MTDRTTCPVPKDSIEFSLPKTEFFTLDNGLKVQYVHKDKLPIENLILILDAGSKFESRETSGLSHLTAMLLDEGAGPYSALEFDDEIEKLGSVLSISNNHDALYISLLTLRENFDRSLELLSYLLTSPHFDEEDFAREKYKLENKLQQMYDDPSYIASTVFEKICFDGTSYALPAIGSISSVKNLTIKDVKDFYLKHFSPETSTLIAVGSTSKDELKEILNRHFGEWKLKFEGIAKEANFPSTKQEIFLIDKPESAQSELRIGHISEIRKSPDYFDKMITNTALGGQFSSRINLNLREKRGFTYGANSNFSYNASTGVFRVATAVNIENTGEAIEEIFKEIAGIKEDIKQQEVDFAKSYLVKSFPSKFETYGQIASNLSTLIVHSLPLDYFNNYISNIELVTRDSALSAAKRSLKEEEMCIVVVADKGVVLPQLKELGYEIIELNYEGERIY